MIVEIKEPMTLKMWSKVDMPESTRNDKGDFVKTGKMLDYTEYVLTDIAGEKAVLISSNNSFRNLEGKICKVTLNYKYSDFDGKSKTSLADITEIKNKA